MEAEIRRLRAEARQLAQGKHPSQVRYPDRFRRAALAFARMRLGPEGSVPRLARDVGVSEPTLTKWLRPPTPPVVRPVAVTPAPTPERRAGVGPVLITAQGVRVEGLDCDTLVAVLQALG
jgi:hypothetical protein